MPKNVGAICAYLAVMLSAVAATVVVDLPSYQSLDEIDKSHFALWLELKEHIDASSSSVYKDLGCRIKYPLHVTLPSEDSDQKIRSEALRIVNRCYYAGGDDNREGAGLEMGRG